MLSGIDSGMKITLNNVGKRFNSEWIFRKINYGFESGNGYVVLGANGSGKSTFMHVIAGSMMVSEGHINYEIEDMRIETRNIKSQISKPPAGRAGLKSQTNVSTEKIFEHLSIAAPYLELFEEYTLRESIAFHGKFKNFFDGLSTDEIIHLTHLEKSKDKQLKYFSSGMKQRVKLALAILSNVPLLLLDEPCSNLDREGVEWYQKLITNYSKNRLIIVCSNQQKDEYAFCNQEILMEGYK